jgi:hypothetical protein
MKTLSETVDSIIEAQADLDVQARNCSFSNSEVKSALAKADPESEEETVLLRILLWNEISQTQVEQPAQVIQPIINQSHSEE